MYIVGREIHFSYGHRLINYKGKCARLHGHNGKAVIELVSPELNSQGMVMDFYEIRESIGKWVADKLDHRMILSSKDPLIGVLREQGEDIVEMEGNPTAEAIARWIFDEARRMKLPVKRVTLWETENSFAAYGD